MTPLRRFAAAPRVQCAQSVCTGCYGRVLASHSHQSERSAEAVKRCAVHGSTPRHTHGERWRVARPMRDRDLGTSTVTGTMYQVESGECESGPRRDRRTRDQRACQRELSLRGMRCVWVCELQLAARSCITRTPDRPGSTDATDDTRQHAYTRGPQRPTRRGSRSRLWSLASRGAGSRVGSLWRSRFTHWFSFARYLRWPLRRSVLRMWPALLQWHVLRGADSFTPPHVACASTTGLAATVPAQPQATGYHAACACSQ